jgi:hypothetical protein
LTIDANSQLAKKEKGAAEIEIPELMPVVVADDEAGVAMLFDDPRRQEAARAKRTPPRRIC